MNKYKLVSWLVVFLVIGVTIGSFIFTHEFHWKTPVMFQKPLTWNKKSYQITQIVQAQEVKGKDVDPLTPDQRYACNKFGDDCVTAVAIMRAESHYRPNAFNINTNGSVDLGCFQINTLWLKEIDTSKINLLNCKDNTDVAYMIYKRNHNSFKDWATYNNGSYKNYLINK